MFVLAGFEFSTVEVCPCSLRTKLRSLVIVVVHLIAPEVQQLVELADQHPQDVRLVRKPPSTAPVPADFTLTRREVRSDPELYERTVAAAKAAGSQVRITL